MIDRVIVLVDLILLQSVDCLVFISQHLPIFMMQLVQNHSSAHAEYLPIRLCLVSKTMSDLCQ